jgi:hypothetical protein
VRHRARGSMARSVRRSGGRRRLLAALVVGSVVVTAVSAVSGAGTAGASTPNIFCVASYNTCLTYPYPANMHIPIYPDPYTTNTLNVTGSWTSATSAAAGTYTETGNAEPVSDITLGTLKPAGNNQYQYTCLSFEVNATNATFYATEAVGTTVWTPAAGSCMAAGGPATAVTTSLSGGGQSGTSITVPAGTAVTDTATLSGANASTATGTVTYDVYSDSACTVAVSAGTAEAITTPGTLPASSPVTLSTTGTYYWQASYYSGDANNGPSTSTCGTAGEVETVSCGSAAVAYQATPVATSHGNWGGYDAESSTACTFTSVTGQWVQPALACPTHDEGTLTAEFWVGLDGAGSATVEQTGIEAQCVWGPSGYHTEYQAWYQMYPDPAVDFTNPDLQAGSLVKATVKYLENGEYSLNLAVTTKGRTLPPLSTEQPCANVCENMSAEWVVEKVQADGLADFRIWHLTDGEATTAANPGEQTVASFKPVRDIINQDPDLSAGPAGLHGSSFFVLTIKR